MDTVLAPPAETFFLSIPAPVIYTIIPVVAIVIFLYMIARRLRPMLNAAPDFRFNRFSERLRQLIKIWLLQYRHPRYLSAGILHIGLFAGFLALSLRSLTGFLRSVAGL